KDAPILIEGERGTGRERVARLMHEIGPRKNHDFVRVDPDDDDDPPRVEDQLAQANGGTLLVKEIAHVGRGPQRKLLRIIKRVGPGQRETGLHVDVRIVAAPLRRRPEDVPVLLEHFGNTEAREVGVDRLRFTARSVDKLTSYSW